MKSLKLRIRKNTRNSENVLYRIRQKEEDRLFHWRELAKMIERQEDVMNQIMSRYALLETLDKDLRKLRRVK